MHCGGCFIIRFIDALSADLFWKQWSETGFIFRPFHDDGPRLHTLHNKLDENEGVNERARILKIIIIKKEERESEPGVAQGWWAGKVSWAYVRTCVLRRDDEQEDTRRRLLPTSSWKKDQQSSCSSAWPCDQSGFVRVQYLAVARCWLVFESFLLKEYRRTC